MIRVIYTDGITDGEIVRVTEWPNKDHLEGGMVRKLLRHAIQETETCKTGICSFDVYRVEAPEAPIYDILDSGEWLEHGESIMFGMADKLDDRTILHYGRSPSITPGTVQGLRCYRVYRSR